jgi:carboxylesterase type B
MRGQWRGRRTVVAIAVGIAAVATATSSVSVASSGDTTPARDAVTQDGQSTLVHTADGVLRGVTTTNYDEFLGVPYARPPIGQLRWTAPQPVAAWSGVRDAGSFGDRCVQGAGWDPGYADPTLTEDCLYLNVYVPHHVQPGSNVLVWIHGGGFTGGAGQDTDPRKYVDSTGGIFVTVNYRLGALGFLDLPQLRTAGAGAGSFGLLDQQAALRWVQRNIRNFGGDPGKVTIAGQSAGGSSVCDQLASPAARGLFQRAVIMSGGCGMGSQATGDQAGQAFATTLGCTDAATELACLRGKTSQQVLQAQQASSPGIRPAVGDTAFPTDPATAVPAGNFNRVPVVNGQVHDERRLFVFQLNDYVGKPVTAASFEATVRATYPSAADRILAAYPLSAYPTPGIALATLQTDAASYGRYQLDTQFAKYVPTYSYEFAEESTPQFYSIYRLQQQGGAAASFNFGATHVDDLGYLWTYLGHTLPYSDDELALSDQMIAFWSQFQRTGDPNVTSAPAWPRFTPSGGAWMKLAACSTSEASSAPAAACSAAGTGYTTDHKFALWSAVLG